MDPQNNNSAPSTPVPSVSGLQPNVAAALSYVLGFITGLVFYMISKEKFVKFHAMQSIILSVGVIVLQLVLGMVPFLGMMISPLIGLASFVLAIMLIIKAYQGQTYKLPVIGDYADKFSN